MKYEERVNRAMDNFMSGYNCSQSVVAAYADLYGFTTEQALKMAASFGAGIGRMRLTCGTACGLFMLAGLETGTTVAEDRAGKSANYAVVQELAARFKAQAGSITCSELLGLSAKAKHDNPYAEPRTAEYYKKRPCVRMVELAARIFGEFLEEREKERESVQA